MMPNVDANKDADTIIKYSKNHRRSTKAKPMQRLASYA